MPVNRVAEERKTWSVPYCFPQPLPAQMIAIKVESPLVVP